MATIYADASDGKVYKSNSDWATARDATSGSSFSSTTSADAFGIRGERTSGRGGGYSYNIQRIFMKFDTSGISSNVDSATLKVYGYSNGGGDIITLKYEELEWVKQTFGTRLISVTPFIITPYK